MSNAPSPAGPSYTYADAGVSIAAGNALVRAIGPLARATRRPGADAELGGFGGMFDLKAAGFVDPLLVRCHDVIERQAAHMSRLLEDLLDTGAYVRIPDLEFDVWLRRDQAPARNAQPGA